MRFLLDMGISVGVAAALRELGHEATHLDESGLGRLSDAEVLRRAETEQAVVVTHDLDFADLLASGAAKLPSVILFRLRDMRPANVFARLEAVIKHHAAQLRVGAIVSVAESQIRIRSLPIGGSDE
jgi:predicted nuclease of predicted toxin-antitoxin system